MEFFINRFFMIASAGVNCYVQAMPWLMQFTTGGSDQLLATAVAGTLALIRPILTHYASLVKTLFAQEEQQYVSTTA